MSLSLKETLSHLGRVKHIGIIAALLVLGLLLCVADPDSFNVHTSSGDAEREIAELCLKLTGDEPFVTVNTDTDGSPSGIAVVINGVCDPNVKLNITEMLSTLYAISSSRIYVTGTLTNG